MSNAVLQVDYDELAIITQAFGLQTAVIRQITQSLQQQYLPLEQGDWQGDAGRAFCTEMRTSIFPALQRLQAAMQAGRDITQRASDLLADGEREAAALFHGDYASTTSAHSASPLEKGQPSHHSKPGAAPPTRNASGDGLDDLLPDLPLPDRTLLWLNNPEYTYTAEERDALPDYDPAIAEAERQAAQERAAREAGTYSHSPLFIYDNPLDPRDDKAGQGQAHEIINRIIDFETSLALLEMYGSADSSALLNNLIGDLLDLSGVPFPNTLSEVISDGINHLFRADNSEADLWRFHANVDQIHDGNPLITDEQYVLQRLNDSSVRNEIQLILEDITERTSHNENGEIVRLYLSVAPDGEIRYNAEQMSINGTPHSFSFEITTTAFNIMAPILGAEVSNDYANYLDQSELYIHQGTQFIETADRRSSTYDEQMVIENAPPFVQPAYDDLMIATIQTMFTEQQYVAMGLYDYNAFIPPTPPVSSAP